MTEEDRSAKVGGSADRSAIITGDRNTATITITNYYYRENTTLVPIESTGAADENLPCPYRGLFHFGPDDAEFFFGREVFVEELFAATQNRNFIPVLGASGSGKSSVVLAGLVPKLQKENHWLFTHFRPGSDPFHALALALVPLYTQDLNATEMIAQARQLAVYFLSGTVTLADVFAQIHKNHGNHRVLLIADQFEELYTLCGDQKVRLGFLDTLLACFQSSPDNTTVLVATMRADFLGNVLSYRPLADVLQNADIKLGPMNREELSQVIKKPSEKLGVTFEAGLVKRILDDVEDEPGNLPLLEFALTQLWKRRTGKLLTHAAYEEIGEVKGALARHADENYGKLSATEKEQVRRIFIQLVRAGEGTEDTRRLATKAELGEASWELVKQLADNRLVVTSQNAANQETVEVVHEALIRNWGEFRQWMNTDRSFRAWQERLRGTMYQWEQTQRDEGALLRGAALAEAQENLKQRREELSAGEQEFIRASVEVRDREHNQRERRRQLTFSGLAGGLVLALSLSGFAWWQWRLSEITLLKQSDALSYYSNELFNQGKEFDALIEGLRAGIPLRSRKAHASMQVVATLQQAVYIVKERNRLEGHRGSVKSVVFSPDGKTIASASNDNTVKLWNLQGKLLTTLTGHSGSVNNVVFSPDGKTIASASEDHTVKLWNLQGKLLTTLTGYSVSANVEGSAWINSVAFSPDGKTIASASKDNTVKLWDTQGKLLQTLTGHNDSVYMVAFSPDGKTIASASWDNTVKLWDTQGKLLQTFKGHKAKVNMVAFSPDGKTIASASWDNTVKLWDTQGKLLQTLTGHNDSVYMVAFSPDGKTIASASWDNTVKLWDTQGKLLQTLTGHNDSVYMVAFSPDGKTIASASQDKTVKLWDTQGKLLQTLTGHNDSVYMVAFSPDGKIIASASADDTVKLWNLQGLATPSPSRHSGSVNNVVFSPDGKTIASASEDKTVKLWNLKGELLSTLSGHSGSVNSVVFSPDGKTIASASEDNTVNLWNLKGELLSTLSGHSGSVNKVVFSPDGKTIASTSEDKTVKLWNLKGELLSTLSGHSGSVNKVVFSPDGKTIASASEDNTVNLWNLKGELLSTLSGHSGSVNKVVFSPDGKTVATISEDNTVNLWNLQGKMLTTFSAYTVNFSPDGRQMATAEHDDIAIILRNLDGKETAVLKGRQFKEGDDSGIGNVTFSPDGKFIAAIIYTCGDACHPEVISVWDLSGKKVVALKYSSHQNFIFSPDSKFLVFPSDESVKLWNLKGKVLTTLFGHSEAVNNVEFSPDGKVIVTASRDGTVKLWSLDLDDLLAQGCNWARDYLQYSQDIKEESDRHLCDGVSSKVPW